MKVKFDDVVKNEKLKRPEWMTKFADKKKVFYNSVMQEVWRHSM